MAPVPAVFVVSCGATVLISLLVAGGRAGGIDAWLLDRLRHRPAPRVDGKESRTTAALRDLTALGGDTLRLLFVAACLFGLIADHRAAAGFALLAIFVTARLALVLLKRIVRRPRPPDGMPGVATYTSSFPSGHTFLSVVVYLSAALLIPAGAPSAVLITGVAFAVTLGFAVGMTRVALGLHWPSDVLVGWCAGIAWVSGCILIASGYV